MEISNLFPAGTELYSDTFPGLVVTYDSKDHYVIKEGRNEINLAVKVTDIKLAKKSLPALTVVFGIKDIPAKEGEIALKKASVTGITTEHYEELIQKTGDRIITTSENLGVHIENTTIMNESPQKVYVALTGDRCALTDIRIKAI